MIANLLAAALMASSAPADAASLHWRSIGPYRGGRVLAVAGSPDSPQHFFFGAVNGGVWETGDAGRTWRPIFDNVPVGSIGALAVAPSDPNVLYVGTGEADMRSDIAQGLGVFRSSDGGRTWTSAGLADSRQIGRILVDPRDANTVLVAVLGHPYGPNTERGVFRSTDGGRSWSQTLFRGADTGAIDLAFKPGDPDTVYAALWQTRRPPWSVYPPSAGPGGGLFKSMDGGRTWAPIGAQGFPTAVGRVGLATAPSTPERLYALVDAKDHGGLYRSNDAGTTWTKTNADPRIWQRGWYFSSVTVNPKNADELWVCDTIVLHSTDGGRTFVPQKGDPTGDDFHALWIDPANPDRRILGSDQGALVTMNGGATWSSWFNQPTGQFYHVITDNRFPYRVYGAQQDSGAASVPSRTSGWDGINMTHFREQTAGGESDNIAPDPDDPDLIFGGRVDKLDLRSGQVRNVDPTLAFPDRYRGAWTLPLVFSQADHALYFANQRIFRTSDKGGRWTPISPDLTRTDPGIPGNLDPVTAADDDGQGPRKGVVYSIGPSPLSGEDIWAGTDDGLVWRTQDGGRTWADVTPSALSPWSKVGVVEPSHFDRDRAYIAVDRHRLDDQRPYVYRTVDGGKSWSLINSGLAEGGSLNAVNVVREDPIRRGLLFAGTERGVFVSLDDGQVWQPFGADLPVTSVRDIQIHGDDVVIATHGRGFYLLDDIAALRELAAAPGPGTRLFAPAVAVRVRPADFTGTPMPKDEPMGSNPSDGAFIDYRLDGAARSPVEIAILDGQGALVRHYSSQDPSPAPDLAVIDTAPEWIPARTPPSATAGFHRFVWDMRYAAPQALDGGFRTEGVWATPGRYTVKLSVDGQTFSQGLTLVADPRVTSGAQDYQEAFDLARRLEADRVRVRLALAKGKSEALAALSQRLDDLARAVDGADGAPTPDAKAGYRQASAALEALLAKP